MFIGLNPSTADETKNDRTVARCIGYAENWNYGGVYIINLFAFCSTNPAKLYKVKDPIGPENNEWLLRISKKVEKIIAAWGNNGSFNGRSCEVVKLFDKLHCLGITKCGEPKHPLYLRKDVKPIEFEQF
jgi:hypothetical protein